MDSVIRRGERLLPSAIDALAQAEKPAIYASVPYDDYDLSKGFQDIDYRVFARAIDRASYWLDERLGRVNNDGDSFPTFSYEGPKDMRFPILTVAAIKTHRTMLVLSPLASLKGRAHLIDVTQCSHMLYGDVGFQEIVMDTIAQGSHPTTAMPAAPLSDWLAAGATSPYPYSKVWASAWANPVVIFHTSGTTGLPKQITWSNAMMSYNDASARLPRGDDNITAGIGRTRYYTTTGNGPGVSSSLQHSVWRGAVVVFGPAHAWPDAATATSVLSRANVGSMMTTPNIIEAMAGTHAGAQALRGLELLMWTGAPLNERIGEALAAAGQVRLAPVYGTTECAGLQMHVCANWADWNLYEFQAGQGIVFEEQPGGLFELVIRQTRRNGLGQPESEAGYIQPVFCALPQLQEWRSRDLFAPRGDDDNGKSRLWEYRGRKDDFLMLSNGTGLLPTLYEPIIAAHPAVRGALIGGQGKPAPFLLLELAQQGKDREDLENVWSAVEEDVNAPFLGEWVKLRRSKLLVADAQKPFIWSEKGTVSRPAVLELYHDEIESLYI